MPRTSKTLLITTFAVLLLFGCTADEQDPAEADRDHVRERLEQTFSGDRADCIIDSLDDEQIGKMIEEDDLDATGSTLWEWSAAVRNCVVGDDSEPPEDAETSNDGDPSDENSDDEDDDSDGDEKGRNDEETTTTAAD